MRALNWVGIVMLIAAFLLNELFLGMNTWYDLNMGAVIGMVIYLVVGVMFSLWPSPSDDRA